LKQPVDPGDFAGFYSALAPMAIFCIFRSKKAFNTGWAKPMDYWQWPETTVVSNLPNTIP